ncbi:uncharacterized protein LOC122564659 [Chiloscyllium plagiosum]|uniref:uncharacterized protein LOC122564659 n=1 Tax=Chiloscyllium plagiosum TaxID=36176 RepID=UPI001CB8704E|nr:uncharacterized protein LOC122564659 [Chiloscyllium plagiosum]
MPSTVRHFNPGCGKLRKWTLCFVDRHREVLMDGVIHSRNIHFLQDHQKAPCNQILQPVPPGQCSVVGLENCTAMPQKWSMTFSTVPGRKRPTIGQRESQLTGGLPGIWFLMRRGSLCWLARITPVPVVMLKSLWSQLLSRNHCPLLHCYPVGSAVHHSLPLWLHPGGSYGEVICFSDSGRDSGMVAFGDQVGPSGSFCSALSSWWFRPGFQRPEIWQLQCRLSAAVENVVPVLSMSLRTHEP